MNGVDVTVGSAERDQAKELTALHRRTARQAFSEIFPPEASPPTYEEDHPLQALVTNLDRSPYLGRLALCRVRQGTIRRTQPAAWCRARCS